MHADPHKPSDLLFITHNELIVKEAYTGPATLDLYPHALAPLAELPVREIVSVTHTVSDVTLLAGEVVHDYLA